MRIGMIADAYKPHVSGVTNHIALNKQFMEAAGHEVLVFTFGEGEHPDDEPNVIRSRGVPLVDSGFYFNVSYTNEARKLLHSMDIVHVHQPFLSGTLALRYCKPRGIPIVFTNHTRYDLYYRAYLPMLPESLGEAFLQAYLPTFFRAIDKVIAPSEGLRQVLRGYGVTTPIELIPNGVDIQPFQQAAMPQERAQFGFGDDDIVLLYVGRLGPEKNLPFLLRCFAGTFEAYANVRLLIVGDGPERDNLEDRVQHMGLEEGVRFAGLVPYEQLPPYLLMADAFVTASVSEVHPLTVIEAMAAGLPVLGIESPGVSDSVIDGQTGLLAKNALPSFTAKMVRLVTEHEARRKMGAQAREHAKQYDIGRTSKMLLDCYEELVVDVARRNGSLGGRLRRLFKGLREK